MKPGVETASGIKMQTEDFRLQNSFLQKKGGMCLNRTELIRVTPESVGISSKKVKKLVEALDHCGTEMHGIMIARYGKVCAEGWWAPFSPNLVHGLQSMTKTMLSTAVGALVTDGLLDINTKVTELLPEYMPKDPSEELKRLTVRHMLMMTSGCRKTYPACRQDWLSGFFAQPIEDEPGTVFHYDGTNTSAIGAIVSKITGQRDILEYLRGRVFDKIGIDSDRIKWVKHPDGYCYCGGGAFAKLEDILRLGMLYEQNGVWNGERILSEEWIKEAASKQTHNNERSGVPEYTDDSSSGYGYQIWMTKRPGTYYFSGAHGQYVLVMPDKHLVFAINQNIVEVLPKPGEIRKPKDVDIKEIVLGLLKEFGESLEEEPLSEDEQAADELKNYLDCLSRPRCISEPVPENAGRFFEHSYQLSENEISLLPGVYSSALKKFVLCTTADGPVGVERIGLTQFNGNDFLLEMQVNGHNYQTPVGVDGLCRIGHFKVPGHPELPDQVLANGYWREGILHITLNFIETCYSNQISIEQKEHGAVITFYEFYLFDENGFRTVFDVSEDTF